MNNWGKVGPDGFKQYPLHPGQTRVMRSKARFRAAIAGLQSGKSAIGPLFVIEEIEAQLQRDSTHIITGMITAPTYEIMNRATAPALVQTLRGTPYEGEYIESKHQYKSVASSCWTGVIYCLSTDDPSHLEGGPQDFIWCDEGGQDPYSVWLALQGRVSTTNGRIIITSTPYPKHWWLKHDFMDKYLKGDPNYFVAQWDSSQNPKFPQEEYERQKRELAPAIFAMRYKGQFTQPAGLVYPDFATCILKEPLKGITGTRFGGIDWGFTSPFCALAGVEYYDEDEKKNCLYINYERYRSNKTLQQHAAALPRGDIMWYADPSQPSMISEMNAAGHTTIKANNSIRYGIDIITNKIYQRTLKIDPCCTALIAEMAEYAYPDSMDTGKISDVPAKGLDHAADALRYLCAGAERMRL